MAGSSTFQGAERAAVLLMSLGETEAAEVMRHLDPKEVHRVGAAMSELKNVTSEQVNSVVGDFVTEIKSQTSIGIGSDEFVRTTLVKALGQDKAEGMLDRVLHGANTKGLESLKWMDSRAVADIISLEHPQIISIVLAYLDAEQSAEILSLLPEKLRIDVVLRLATLDGIQPAAMNELNEVLEKYFSSTSSSVKSSSVGGVKTAANILNLMDASLEGALIEEVKSVDENLASEIEDLMFVFEDLGAVDDRGIQTLLREVSSDSLIIALKGSSELVKEKIFTNMSKRASEMLRDDLEVKGPVRLSEVEAAQKEILAIARRLSEAGEIMLGGSAAEEYV